MKKVIYIVVFIMIISITACDTSKVTTQTAVATQTAAVTTPSSISTTGVTAQGFENPLTFKNKNDFYTDVNSAKVKNKEKKEVSKQKLEEIVSYFDFAEVPKDIYLDSINVKDVYVALHYTKEGNTALTLEWTRGSKDVKEDDYLKYILEIRDKSRYSIVTINGKNMVKGVVYNGQTSPVGNNYYFVQDGEAIHVFCPSWLWENHKDEEFLNVKKVTVPVN